ncbi:MAG: sigma-70 family RNA polymerase sigma factor [Verrucomicrobiota bacterium]
MGCHLISWSSKTRLHCRRFCTCVSRCPWHFFPPLRSRLSLPRDLYPEHKFSTWLFTIAANLARNHHRWHARHPNVSLDAESETTEQTLGDTLPAATTDPNQAAEAAERAKAVRAAVQALPDDMREAIILCEWEALPVAEAATVLQSTPKAVESRLYRARQILREKLKTWF